MASSRDNSFALSMSKWTGKVGVNLNVFSKKVILEVDQRVSKRSPVDTGRFKGNWMLGVDGIPTAYDENKFDKNKHLEIGSTVAERLLQIPKEAAGHVYYLVNNLPYAKDLEQGSSKQTNNMTGGIVYITVLEFDQIIQEAMNSIKK